MRYIQKGTGIENESEGWDILWNGPLAPSSLMKSESISKLTNSADPAPQTDRYLTDEHGVELAQQLQPAESLPGRQLKYWFGASSRFSFLRHCCQREVSSK
jgi:hypothetical protein